MAKWGSDIPKFKKIDGMLRMATLGFIDTVKEIDKALASRRSEGEIKLLSEFRQKCVELVESARRTLEEFYVNVENHVKKK